MMKLFLFSLLLATTATPTMAFQAAPPMRSRQRRHRAPVDTDVATLLVDEVRFNDYPPPSYYPINNKNAIVASVSPPSPPSWKQILDEAAVTFAEFRELEAAGLLLNDDCITLDEAKRQAAQQFAVFAKQAQYDLFVLNANAAAITTSHHHDDITKVEDQSGRHRRLELYIKNAVVRLAAALGKTTGKVFGGELPENYHD